MQLNMHSLDECGLATASGSQHDEVASPFLYHFEVVHFWKRERFVLLALAACNLVITSAPQPQPLGVTPRQRKDKGARCAPAAGLR
jgi:hypothetical protein